MKLPSLLLAPLEAQMRSAVRHLGTIQPRDGEARRVRGEVRAAFGAAVPPVMVHAASTPLLEAAWDFLVATLLDGTLPRATKEIVAASVSRANRCPYCVDAHVGALHAFGFGEGAEAIGSGRFEALADPDARALAAWGMQSATGGSAPPGGPLEAAELAGTALAFHYINRVVHVFLPPTPFVGPESWRGFFRRRMGLLMPAGSGGAKPATRAREQAANRSSCGLAWADASPRVAAAVSRMDAATNTAAQRFVPGPVRDAVVRAVLAWDGRDAPLGPAVFEQAAGLAAASAGHSSAGTTSGTTAGAAGGMAGEAEGGQAGLARLLLAVALASWRVDDDLVAAARNAAPTDEALFSAVSWAAWTAARHRSASWVA